MIELELTYLAKYLPEGLTECASKKMHDVYIENGEAHLNLRVRKNGEKFEITRKVPVVEGDASKQTETSIAIKKEEFKSLCFAKHRAIEKTRYHYKHGESLAEVDVFEGDLTGLVVVDFEFDSEEKKDAFVMPDFCLADITQEEFIAGGMIAGKKYEDIENYLKRFEYKKISL